MNKTDISARVDSDLGDILQIHWSIHHVSLNQSIWNDLLDLIFSLDCKFSSLAQTKTTIQRSKQPNHHSLMRNQNHNYHQDENELVVSAHLKNIGQNGNLPQIGVKNKK